MSPADGDVDLTVAVDVLVSEVEGVDTLLFEAADDGVVDETGLRHGVPEVAEPLVEVPHDDGEGGRGVESLN